MDSSVFLDTMKQRTDQIEVLAHQSLSTNNKELACRSKIQLMEVMRDIVQRDVTRDLLLLQARIMKLDHELTEGLTKYLF